MKRKLLNLFRRGYRVDKLRLAFEYGLTLATTAHEMGVELTPELVEKAEIMLEGEFTTQSETHLAGHIVPNLMSVFELDTTK